jgi:predicted DCC family thiol-disulfide oxidoreductase YuxK
VNETTADGGASFLLASSERWVTADARSLGFLRIVLGALLIADLGSRWGGIEAFDSNVGVLTNHFALFRPVAPHQFSLFFAIGQARDVVVAFWLTLAVYASFLIGYRTRLSHLLSLLLATSLHARNLLAELPSDVALHWVLAWTLFLPLGARFSVDGVRRSWRDDRERAPHDLARRSAPPQKIVSVAVLGLLLQLAAMHIGPALAAGATWQDGTALYYALHQSARVTTLGHWVGDSVPFRALTMGYRVAYALAGGLVLLPWASARRLALFALVLLHIGCRALFDMGLYDEVVLAPALIVVGAHDWDRLRDAYAARKPRLSVYFDADCGICFAIARLLKRLDALGRLRFEAGAGDEAPPEVRALADKTICVTREPNGAIEVESKAVARILRSLPLMAPVGWLLSAPGISWVADRIYEWIAPRRADVSVFFGFASCGVRRAADHPRPPSARRSSAFGAMLRDVAAGWLLALAALALVLRIDDDTAEQGWPSVAPQDGTVVIDAVSGSAQHVELLPPAERGLLWRAYFDRINETRYAPYLDGLREYIHNMRDRASGTDRLVSFTVSWEQNPIAFPGGERHSGASDSPIVRRKLTGQP